MRVFVLLENDYPVGVTRSKTKAESWIFSKDHDYLTFEMEEPELYPPHAPEVERGATPVQNLIRNLNVVDEGLTKADKDLKNKVKTLEKTLKRKFKSGLLNG